jgi:hypothetical protein
MHAFCITNFGKRIIAIESGISLGYILNCIILSLMFLLLETLCSAIEESKTIYIIIRKAEQHYSEQQIPS